MPGGDGCERGRGVLEERRPVPCATSRHRAAPSRARHLPGNCELRSRFPRGAKINNGAVLLPAGMIKLLIRSSNYSALLIPLLSRAVNYPARVAVGQGLTRLGALQGTGAWGALGCLRLGVLAGLPVRRGEMLALGTGPRCPLSTGLPDPGSGGCGSQERLAISPRQLRTAWAGWFGGNWVWRVQGWEGRWEGRREGVQLGSGTIWTANASMQHAAIWEALHTRLRFVRSEVLRGLGALLRPQGRAARPGLGAMPRLWAELRVSGWLISYPFLAPGPWDTDNRCPWGSEQGLWPHSWGKRTREVAWLPQDRGTEAGPCACVRLHGAF